MTDTPAGGARASRKSYTHGRVYVGRLPNGADLLEAITHISNEEGIKVGTVMVNGSVARAVLTVAGGNMGFPVTIERDERMEIASMTGTISQFKGRSLARLGAALAGSDGSLIGGTLAVGTIVFACEVVIMELEGATLTRDFDAETGLPLWKAGSLLM